MNNQSQIPGLEDLQHGTTLTTETEIENYIRNLRLNSFTDRQLVDIEYLNSRLRECDFR